jgi:lysophospholipase L1-like esterase
MRPLVGLAMVGSLMLSACLPVRAATCPVPDPFVIPHGGLPATQTGVAIGRLTILSLGGSATVGAAARGAEFTYPARLEARLRAALPKVEIRTEIRAASRLATTDILTRLDADLAAIRPGLVIWGPGASAAARGDDLESFNTVLAEVIRRVRLSGADLVMMTLQFAPSVVRVMNPYPYRMAVIRGGDMAGVPVLDRYELMHFWSGSGFMNLDATDAEDRVRVARRLYDCMAEILAEGIVNAVK